MNNKLEYLIDLILNKLKNNKVRKIDLDKEEFSKFINFLINNNF